MARFKFGIAEKTEVQVNRKCIQWMVDFRLPESVKERMANDDLIPIDGVFAMDFYSDPLTGDYLTHKGHRWQIVGREFVATVHLKREPKSIPRLIVKYVGETL